MSLFQDPELILDGSGPIHSQIERQLRRHIQANTLTPGEELPTVRAVAVALAINPSAVEEAYDHLEREGYLTRNDGAGVLVAPRPPRAVLEDLCVEFLRQAACNGYATSDVLRVLHAQIYKEMP
jgi:GntR family transcriptional regulator